MESEADNRTVSVVGVRGFKQSCGSWSTADALKSLIDDVQGVVSLKEKVLHFLCLLYKITIIRAQTTKTKELREGYTVLSVGIVGRSVVEVRVGICGFVVNRCLKSSLCEGDIDVQKGDCSFGDGVCEADCRVEILHKMDEGSKFIFGSGSVAKSIIYVLSLIHI